MNIAYQIVIICVGFGTYNLYIAEQIATGIYFLTVSFLFVATGIIVNEIRGVKS